MIGKAGTLITQGEANHLQNKSDLCADEIWVLNFWGARYVFDQMIWRRKDDSGVEVTKRRRAFSSRAFDSYNFCDKGRSPGKRPSFFLRRAGLRDGCTGAVKRGRTIISFRTELKLLPGSACNHLPRDLHAFRELD
jgi:hypothetical protein